ncbi:MAG: hypothetical protein JO090_16135 [Rhizobacter sp.]|nr:hypothetical protein [Rhizobacter sp.]
MGVHQHHQDPQCAERFGGVVPSSARKPLRWIALSGFLLSAGAQAQHPEQLAIRALGAFDQIATECSRGGTESQIESFRVKLWRAYLVGQGDDDTSSARIGEMIARLRSEMVDDVTDELRRQYKSARDAVPDISGLSAEQQREFYKLCESPTIRGLPP